MSVFRNQQSVNRPNGLSPIFSCRWAFSGAFRTHRSEKEAIPFEFLVIQTRRVAGKKFIFEKEKAPSVDTRGFVRSSLKILSRLVDSRNLVFFFFLLDDDSWCNHHHQAGC